MTRGVSVKYGFVVLRRACFALDASAVINQASSLSWVCRASCIVEPRAHNVLLWGSSRTALAPPTYAMLACCHVRMHCDAYENSMLRQNHRS